MTITNLLASSLNRRDEIPNQELAIKLSKNGRPEDIKELIDNLKSKNKDIQSDSIKVLYEIGELKPDMIAQFLPVFIDLLDNKNNRLQWGAMTAIGSITSTIPAEVIKVLPRIIKSAQKGSVITMDNAIVILIRLCQSNYQSQALPLLIELMSSSPNNQLPMYAEKALPIVNQSNKEQFIHLLNSRIEGIDKESKRKRVEKVIIKIAQL